jgi:hypothetical protein
VLALAGIWWWATKSVEQAVAAEAEKVVKARTDFVDQSVKTITSTAVAQVAVLQTELEKAKASLASSHQQVDATMKQAEDVKEAATKMQLKLQEIEYAHQMITTNAAFLNDPAAVARVSSFVKLVSEDRNASTISLLALQVASLTDNVRDVLWHIGGKDAPTKDDELDGILWHLHGGRMAHQAAIDKADRFQAEMKASEENRREIEHRVKEQQQQEEADRAKALKHPAAK